MPVPEGDDSAARVIDVTTGYRLGTPVLSGLTAAVPARGIAHLRGPNGSGKSTFLELLSGYLRPWSGRVEVLGVPAADPRARARRRVCRTRPAVYARMTARDHLVFAARCAGASPAPLLDRADRLELGPWLDEDAATLSTGNTRKLWYLMCTVEPFTLALLDEPFNGLDDAAVAVVAAELREWSATSGVVLISHAPPAAVTVGSVLDLGQRPVGTTTPGGRP